MFTEGKVYYYKVICKCDEADEPLSNLFDAYLKLYDNNGSNLEDRGLAVPYYDKFHFLEVFQHEYDKNIYQGKFYSLRSTDFPYLFNLLNGNRQEISAGDDDTLMEQTHFCCIVSKNLCVSEFNFHGARIEKLVQNEWVEKISNRSKYVDSNKMFAAILKAYLEQKDIALKYMEKMYCLKNLIG